MIVFSKHKEKNMPRKDERVIIDKILIFFGIVTTLALLALGGITWWASTFIGNQVESELVAQHIYFPEKGSQGFSSEEFPGLQQYAGQPVDNAPKAKAFADEYIAAHLKQIGQGKTYAEVSTEAMKDPSNKALQQQKTTLFQGETLRGLLLNAYAFGTVGNIARIAALVSLIAGVVIFILVLLGFKHLRLVSRR